MLHFAIKVDIHKYKRELHATCQNVNPQLSWWIQKN